MRVTINTYLDKKENNSVWCCVYVGGMLVYAVRVQKGLEKLEREAELAILYIVTHADQWIGLSMNAVLDMDADDLEEFEYHLAGMMPLNIYDWPWNDWKFPEV